LRFTAQDIEQMGAVTMSRTYPTKNLKNCLSLRQQGLSLIELMISMLLGSVLALGVVNLYAETKSNYFQDEQTYRMQEGARFAMRLLTREISMSGFPLGVVDVDIITVNAVLGDDCGPAGENWALDPAVSLEHSDKIAADISDDYSCIADSSMIEVESGGSDLLVVKRSADSKTYDDGTLSAGASLAASSSYFRISNGGNSVEIVKGSAVAPADVLAGSGIDLWEYYVHIFMIRNYSIETDDGIPTLIVGSLDDDGIGAPEAYVEGLEKLNMEFGIDSDDDKIVDYFDADPSAAEIDNSIAIRVYILMRSIEPIANYVNDKSYQLGSENVPAKNDGFLRRVYSSTVKVRNRPGVG